MRLFRPTLLVSVSLVCGLGCSPKVATGALKVEVVYDANIVSKCVKVVATDDVGSPALETMPISLANQTSPLLVGVGGSSPLAQPFRVQALGYSDVGCTTRNNEESTAEPGVFAVPPQTVTLVLKAQPQNDGGTTDGGGGDAGATDAGDGDGGTADAGTDGGAGDAGTDLDMDGWFAGTGPNADCNDNNPLIHPGRAEVCNNNNVDDNCNGLTDCAEGSCDGGTCTNAGTCTNGTCITTVEVCNDGVDNNANNLIDCAETTCATQACNDSNSCTMNETCSGADGGCAGAPVVCMTPPACHAMAGVCQPDGGMCSYTPLNSGVCNDGLACTDNDTCVTGVCTGTPRPCTTSNVCLATTGTCREDAGTCTFTPLVTGPCNDNKNCTQNDTCDGDGGCTGTPVNCAEPSQCHQWDQTCQSNGSCNFVPRATCDAGTSTPGTCNPGFQCVAPAANVFPYTPSTFTEAQLPSGTASAFTVSCNTVLNTSGATPAIVDGGCVTLPLFAILPATDGGQESLLLRVTQLNVNSSATLTFIGPRPVIIAVEGSATIDGRILANSGDAPASLCGNGTSAGTGKEGGGGGGFGGPGADGGQSPLGTIRGGGLANGTSSLDPIRGGCAGGDGAVAAGGVGGGAFQLSVAGSLNVNGSAVIAAAGFGGAGAATTDRGGGGGGSGGALLLEANSLTTASGAWLTANGGGGGGGEDSGGGGPGSPGNLNSATAAGGGNGPNNAGNGGTGGTGTTAPTVGQNTADNDGAGGGGGAVGRIRLRAPSCTGVNAGTNFSPPRAGGC